jgi:hypothetical protein
MLFARDFRYAPFAHDPISSCLIVGWHTPHTPHTTHTTHTHTHTHTPHAHSDITFQVDNQAEIPAHKAILAARCPALLSLVPAPSNHSSSPTAPRLVLTPSLNLLFIFFKGAEDGGCTFLLPGVNEAVFRKLLEFVYTGDVRRCLFWC